MNWYIAKIIYRIASEADTAAQYDEQLRLLQAEDLQAANVKAHDIGRQEEQAFFNQHQQLVQWQLLEIADIRPVSAIADGAEIYSHIEEPENEEAYLQIVHRKGLIYKALPKELLQEN